jgi:hypothetical protein
VDPKTRKFVSTKVHESRKLSKNMVFFKNTYLEYRLARITINHFIVIVVIKKTHTVWTVNDVLGNIFHTKVSLLGVDSLWGDCTFILADWES